MRSNSTSTMTQVSAIVFLVFLVFSLLVATRAIMTPSRLKRFASDTREGIGTSPCANAMLILIGSSPDGIDST